MVYVGAQRFFIAPQIAPHLPLLRPILSTLRFFAYWPKLTLRIYRSYDRMDSSRR